MSSSGTTSPAVQNPNAVSITENIPPTHVSPVLEPIDPQENQQDDDFMRMIDFSNTVTSASMVAHVSQTPTLASSPLASSTVDPALLATHSAVLGDTPAPGTVSPPPESSRPSLSKSGRPQRIRQQNVLYNENQYHLGSLSVSDEKEKSKPSDKSVDSEKS